MKLREWRLHEKLTLAQVAEKLGVTEVTVSRYETGTRMPEREIMKRIFALTGGAVQPNDFFTDASEPDPGTPPAARGADLGGSDRAAADRGTGGADSGAGAGTAAGLAAVAPAPEAA